MKKKQVQVGDVIQYRESFGTGMLITATVEAIYPEGNYGVVIERRCIVHPDKVTKVIPPKR